MVHKLYCKMLFENFIDHTLLRATATEDDIDHLCLEALTYKFYAVCVNGCYIALAKDLLKNSKVRVVAVVGFPLGAMSTEAKVDEAKDYIEKGADELDMVLNLSLIHI